MPSSVSPTCTVLQERRMEQKGCNNGVFCGRNVVPRKVIDEDTEGGVGSVEGSGGNEFGSETCAKTGRKRESRISGVHVTDGRSMI